MKMLHNPRQVSFLPEHEETHKLFLSEVSVLAGQCDHLGKAGWPVTTAGGVFERTVAVMVVLMVVEVWRRPGSTETNCQFSVYNNHRKLNGVAPLIADPYRCRSPLLAKSLELLNQRCDLEIL